VPLGESDWLLHLARERHRWSCWQRERRLQRKLLLVVSAQTLELERRDFVELKPTHSLWLLWLAASQLRW